MKLLPLILIAATTLSVSQAQGQPNDATQLTPKDLATADGSCRVGLQTDNNLVCILTAVEARVELSPDSWSSDTESTNWTSWLTDFDDALYTRWLKNASINGQETVSFRIADGNISVVNGTFLQRSAPEQSSLDEQKSKFEAEIKSALEQTLKASAPIPQTKNKLKEVKTRLTFMRDPKVLPQYGKMEFGFVATKSADNNVEVYGRTKDTDGRSPGIQILQDRGGGTIKVMSIPEFKEKCNAIGTEN